MTGNLVAPDKNEVARRLLAIAVFVQRAGAEAWSRENRATAEKQLREINEWVAKDGLASFLTPEERARFERPLGSWEGVEISVALNQSEALGTLLWSMSLLDMPSPGGRFSWEDVNRLFGEAEAEADVAARLHPRSLDACMFAQMVAETWLWRDRTRQVTGDGVSPEERLARTQQIASLALAKGLVTELRGSDFVVDRRPYAQLSEAEAFDIFMAAFERNIALLWVLGAERDWDRLRTMASMHEDRGDAAPPSFLTPPPAHPRAALSPPSEEEVARRALCVTALMLRGGFEKDGPDERARRPIAEIAEWLESSGLAHDLSPRERAVLLRPAGTLSGQEILDALWRTEAHGVLLWALSVTDDFPGYDAPFRPMFEESGVMRRLDQLLSRVVLREIDEIRRARDLAELWHWRSRTTQAVRLGLAPPPGIPYQEILERTSVAAHKEGILPPPIGGDFPLFGRAYRDLSEEQYEAASSIARERHFALNWLCGYSQDWDSTPTET
jgi:hypothetical protein